jgi:hypothetical protein
MDAWNTPPGADTTLAEPNEVLPVANVTVPVGMPTAAELMVAVKVTEDPGKLLLGLLKGGAMARVDVVNAVLTVTEKGDELLPSKKLDPR